MLNSQPRRGVHARIPRSAADARPRGGCPARPVTPAASSRPDPDGRRAAPAGRLGAQVLTVSRLSRSPPGSWCTGSERAMQAMRADGPRWPPSIELVIEVAHTLRVDDHQRADTIAWRPWLAPGARPGARRSGHGGVAGGPADPRRPWQRRVEPRSRRRQGPVHQEGLSFSVASVDAIRRPAGRRSTGLAGCGTTSYSRREPGEVPDVLQLRRARS
jgi:hypothetical protein